MQFLLLIYEAESNRAARSPAAQKEIFEEYVRFTRDIVKSGHFRAGDPLQPVATAATVQKRDGKVVNTAGPFAETREQLGGYYLIDAQDMDEALAIAARIPVVSTGSVEVRPLMAMPKP